jgi:hypothetical protein
MKRSVALTLNPAIDGAAEAEQIRPFTRSEPGLSATPPAEAASMPRGSAKNWAERLSHSTCREARRGLSSTRERPYQDIMRPRSDRASDSVGSPYAG